MDEDDKYSLGRAFDDAIYWLSGETCAVLLNWNRWPRWLRRTALVAFPLTVAYWTLLVLVLLMAMGTAGTGLWLYRVAGGFCGVLHALWKWAVDVWNRPPPKTDHPYDFNDIDR